MSINLYPDQMRAIAAMCEALNAVGEEAVLFNRISIQSSEGDNLGFLVDEVGGAFSWAPPDWFDRREEPDAS